MLLILLSIVSNGGQVDEKDFASKLRNWMFHGFSELGDQGQLLVNPVIVTSQTGYHTRHRWTGYWYDSGACP